MSSFRSRGPVMWVVAAALVGAVGALGVQRLLAGSGSTPVTPAAADRAEAGGAPNGAPNAAPSAALEPVNTGGARAAIIEALSKAGVPAPAVHHGVYPLRGANLNAAATLPLVSFTCPAVSRCAAALSAVEAAGAAAGFETAGAVGGDTEGRPSFRALTQQGRPVMAVRAFPPGPRLTLVVADLGRDSQVVDALLSLDEHVTFAVDSAAPGAASLTRRLVAQGREVVAEVSIAPGSSPETVRQAAESALEALPGVVGLGSVGLGGEGSWLSAEQAPLGALLGVARARSVYYFEARPAAGTLVGASARTMGTRAGSGTHYLGDPARLNERLRAVEAALVLDGSAVVVVPPDPQVIAGLRPFLAGLKSRQIHLLRLSEIVL